MYIEVIEDVLEGIIGLRIMFNAGIKQLNNFVMLNEQIKKERDIQRCRSFKEAMESDIQA